MNASPRVTVLLPVYNGELYLLEAIDSILTQTFHDFELLIIDDGSTDESVALIEGIHDSRIRLVCNGTNKGLVASLNRGIGLAHGEYIARMDADDISLYNRFERQVCFMDANMDVDVCGCWLEAFDGYKNTIWAPPLSDEEIKSNLFFESVLYHPTVMIRKSALINGSYHYDFDYPHAEDYELWCRMMKLCRFANIGEVLLRYRLHDQSIGRRKADIQVMSAGKVRHKLLKELGIKPTGDDLMLHDAISAWRIKADRQFLEQAHAWLLSLCRANGECGIVLQEVFEKVLAKRWYEICFIATPIGVDACRFFYKSPLSSLLTLPFRHSLVFWMRALLGRT